MTEAHGTIGDETAKLIDAAQDWMRRNLGEASDPACTWCPICQLIAVLRGDRPEVSDKISEAAASVVAALRALVETAAAHQPEQREHRVQHIDLGPDEA